jgi:hypothetical protein
MCRRQRVWELQGLEAFNHTRLEEPSAMSLAALTKELARGGITIRRSNRDDLERAVKTQRAEQLTWHEEGGRVGAETKDGCPVDFSSAESLGPAE